MIVNFWYLIPDPAVAHKQRHEPLLSHTYLYFIQLSSPGILYYGVLTLPVPWSASQNSKLWQEVSLIGLAPQLFL